RFPLEVRIDEYPPLVKFSGEFGILEASEGVLPVTLRNLDAAAASDDAAILGRRLHIGAEPQTIASWLRRVHTANEPRGEYVRDAAGESKWREDTGSTSVFTPDDATTALSIRKPEGARPAEVVGIPLGAPGLYVVELESHRLGTALLGRDAMRYVSAAALVTNVSVHFKWGRESSLVWVTRLDNAQPIAGAQVVITDYCNGFEHWHGTTDRNGIATVEHSLGDPHDNDLCREYVVSKPLLITATAPSAPSKRGAVAAADFGFVLSSWNKGIAPHEFGLTTGSKWNLEIFHTVLDRTLFRAGDTVSMKHFLRQHVRDGVAVADEASGAHKVTIAHQGSDQRYDSQVSFEADGVAAQTWKIPAEAKLGDYVISVEDGEKRVHESGRFKVQEFRLPTMRASVRGSPQPLVRPRDATLDLHVGYVSGGGASGMPVKVRTLVQPWPLEHAGYDDYRFDGAPVQEGVQIMEGGYWDLDFEGEGPQQQSPKTQVMPVTLDAQGAARVTIASLPAVDSPSVLTAELEYADANGELLTTSGSVRLVPAELSVGIRPEGWAASSEQMRFRVVALD